MNYNNLSDFEINKTVAEVLFSESDVCSIEEMGFGNSDKGEVQVIHEVGISGEIVNYCNDPADAWPIIVENGIDISWPEYELGAVGTATKYLRGNTDIYVDFTNKDKALRAAMIVFLMMQEEA